MIIFFKKYNFSVEHSDNENQKPEKKQMLSQFGGFDPPNQRM